MRVSSGFAVLAAAVSAGCPRVQEPAPPSPAVTVASPPSSAQQPPTAPCEPGLAPEVLARIQMEASGRDVAPGARVELRVGIYTSPDVPFEPVPACVTWSIDDARMAKIDRATQTLTVLPGARGKIHLRATAAGRADAITGELTVISASIAPIAGVWREDARLDCATKTWSAPQNPIRELHVRAAGEMKITWHPFEIYYDYEASFVWDPDSTAMTLRVTWGNYIPADMRTSGTARIEEGALILEGIWLGSAKGAVETPACAHRFKR